MTATDSNGVYVHIPFCISKCNYCDFCSFAFDEQKQEEYTKALILEINSFKNRSGKLKADTLFFGGGTPSVLPPRLFEKIYEAIADSFDFSEDSEITLEANPGTLTSEKLSLYRELGVNRLSLGVQSIHEKELKKLGRIHSYDSFLSNYFLARDVGFDNINLDVMYGIPYQTKESFCQTLKELVGLRPEHLSVYGLILEEGTSFYNEQKYLCLPSEDEECGMYYSAHELLSQHGYSHYEISNYAMENYECRHNLKYWQIKPYIGFGLSAHSHFCAKRFYNTSNLDEYLASPATKYKYEESENSDSDEYIMLALRTAFGISLDDFYSMFGFEFLDDNREKLVWDYIKLGLMERENNRIFLTPRGFYVSNTIIASLF